MRRAMLSHRSAPDRIRIERAVPWNAHLPARLAARKVHMVPHQEKELSVWHRPSSELVMSCELQH
jgi:hypothetical protein